MFFSENDVFLNHQSIGSHYNFTLTNGGYFITHIN